MAATIVTGAAVASAALAGLGALKLGPAAASQYPKKVTVCHRTHSKKHPWVKISISTRALKAHIRHGDFLVTANSPCPPPSVATAKNKSKHHGKPSGKSNAKGKSGKNGAQAKGKAKSGKNSAQATGKAKSGKNSAQAKGSNAKGGENSAQAKGKAKSAKNGAQGKGKGKNSAAPTNNHSNNKGGNGRGNK